MGECSVADADQRPILAHDVGPHGQRSRRCRSRIHVEPLRRGANRKPDQGTLGRSSDQSSGCGSREVTMKRNSKSMLPAFAAAAVGIFATQSVRAELLEKTKMVGST